MTCPKCRKFGSGVVNSRNSSDGSKRNRRRECKACRHRWSTVEAEAGNHDWLRPNPFERSTVIAAQALLDHVDELLGTLLVPR